MSGTASADAIWKDMNPDDLRRADAIEVVVGQGAKPGGGGMLLGHKISDRVAAMRDLPKGIDQRSASRHPDWTGPDDLEIKIHELREITDWHKPIFVKVGATRTYYDVQLAVKAGADVIVVDGMQGGTAATQDVFIEHVGIPTLAATRLAVDALQELGMGKPVATFSVGFDVPGSSELPYARQVADTFGSDHSELVVNMWPISSAQPPPLKMPSLPR